jgi:hypothetical protein
VVRTVAALQRFRPAWPFGPWPETREDSVHGARRWRRLESGEPVARGGVECSLGRCRVHGESDLGLGARGISPARGLHSGARRAGRSGGVGSEGSSGLELERS